MTISFVKTKNKNNGGFIIICVEFHLFHCYQQGKGNGKSGHKVHAPGEIKASGFHALHQISIEMGKTHYKCSPCHLFD